MRRTYLPLRTYSQEREGETVSITRASSHCVGAQGGGNIEILLCT